MNLEKIIYTQRNLNNMVSEINGFFDDFFIFYNDNKPKNFLQLKKEQLALKLFPLLINGATYNEAKKIIANSVDLPIDYINKTLDSYYYTYLYRLRPHKIYACHKLHEAGINNVTIAKLLNLTPATIGKYLLIPNKLE